MLGSKTTMSQIDHPNIVKLIEVFETPQAFCIVFEIMNGGEVSPAQAALRPHLR